MLSRGMLAYVLAFMLLYPKLIWQGDYSICFYNQATTTPKTPLTADDIVKLPIIKHIESRVAGKGQRIPYLIHQTNQQDILPADMLLAIETTLEHNPEYGYRYYNGTERRNFVRDRMGPIVLACYDKLIPNAFKADLFRYSAIYTLGGCYTDIGFIFVGHLRDVIRSQDRFVSTPDGYFPFYQLNSAFFCAEAGHPILKATIQHIINRVAKSQYGASGLDITGPWAFKTGFSRYYQNDTIDVVARQYPNNVRLLDQQLERICVIYPIVDPASPNKILLYHKYARYLEDMSTYSGQAHYNYYFLNRTVYNESVVIPYSSSTSDPSS